MSLAQDAPALFNGTIIQQICFGLYDLQLRFFTEGLVIQTGNQAEYMTADGICYKWDGMSGGRIPFPISALLEVEVEKAEVDNNENLLLRFANGDRLTIPCRHDGLESYVVWVKGSFYVVSESL